MRALLHKNVRRPLATLKLSRKLRALSFVVTFVGANLFLTGCNRAKLSNVSFAQSTDKIEAYDFVEVTADVGWPRARNPFTDASLTGSVQTIDGSRSWTVDGFCDSEDGSTFRLRFM